MLLQIFLVLFSRFFEAQPLSIANSGVSHAVSVKSGALHPLFGRIYPTIYGKRGADS